MTELSNSFKVGDVELAQATIQVALLSRQQKAEFVNQMPANTVMCIKILLESSCTTEDQKSGYMAGFLEALYIFSICHSLKEINSIDGLDAKLKEFMNEIMEPPAQ